MELGKARKRKRERLDKHCPLIPPGRVSSSKSAAAECPLLRCLAVSDCHFIYLLVAFLIIADEQIVSRKRFSMPIVSVIVEVDSAVIVLFFFFFCYTRKNLQYIPWNLMLKFSAAASQLNRATKA